MTRGPTDAELALVARQMRRRARRGVFDGRVSARSDEYLARCRRVKFGTTLIFTRDAGHHTSGWFKNPQYERCWHLSTSPVPRVLWTPGTPDLDHALRDRWLRAFFGDDLGHVWAESPKTPQGRAAGVYHWRLFCDERWQAITPKGEVYSLDLTELGWKSATELGVTNESPLVPG